MSLLKKEIKTKQNPSDLHFAGRHPFLFVFTSLYLIELQVGEAYLISLYLATQKILV